MTENKFHKQKADADELETISLLGKAVSKLLRDDGASPDVCRHVLLRLAVTHYYWNIKNGASKEEVGQIMWEEYATIIRQVFQEDAADILGIMLNSALQDANQSRGLIEP